MARIAIDARKLGDLGIGTYIEGTLRALAGLDRQNEYRLLVPSAEALVLGGRFHPVLCKAPKYSWRELVVLPRLLWRERVELFHSPHYVVPPWCPCPVVVTIHDLIHLRFPELLATPLHRMYARLMLRRTARQARRIITVSEHSKGDIVAMLRVPAERVRVIPNGVDARFRPVQDEAALEGVRRRYALPKRFVLCVGSINPHKNVPGLLAAFEKVAAQEDVDLVLVGESARRDAKVQAVREAIGRTARVRQIPHVPHQELPALYSLAEVFVTPSLYEGFGLTPLEAMACGAPVVAARSASLPEVLGDAALWVEPRDVQGLAQGLLRLCDDAALRQELAEKGRTRAARYSWEAAARQTLDVYREVLAQ